LDHYESSARQARVWAISVAFCILVICGSISGYYGYKLHVNSSKTVVKTVLIYDGGPEQEIITPTSSTQSTK